MKKVLFVTSISGFLPQFEKNDVKILKEMGCEIHYASNFRNPVYTFDKRELTESGIILHHIPITKSPADAVDNFRAVCRIKKIIDENGIDIVHCHNPMGGVAGRFAAAWSKRKPYVIYTAHGFHFYDGASPLNWLFFYPAERLMARMTDCIVTINREDYGRAAGFRLKDGGSVCQIHGVGVDKERFDRHPEIAERKRRELEVPMDAFHIVTAAELNDNKNQRVIIEALAGMPDKKIFYSICGKGSNKDKLEALVQEKGLSGRVRLLGFRTDMEEILQTADCFAFPSRREGLGIAAVEALLCGVPLVAADNRGTREYAIQGANAMCCKAEDMEGFRNAIERLYKERQLRERMREYARLSVLKFDIKEVEKTMKEVYERALKSC